MEKFHLIQGFNPSAEGGGGGGSEPVIVHMDETTRALDMTFKELSDLFMEGVTPIIIYNGASDETLTAMPTAYTNNIYQLSQVSNWTYDNEYNVIAQLSVVFIPLDNGAPMYSLGFNADTENDYPVQQS